MKVNTHPESIPTLSHGPPKDTRKRHIVERVGGPESKLFSRVALCGKKMKELLLNHSGEICQECVDEQKRRPRR